MTGRTVAIVTPYYAPQIGGVERYAERLATEMLHTADLRPVVITTGPGRRRRREVRDGVTVVRLPAWLTLSNTPVNPLWFVQVELLLRRLDVDVVNTHSPVPFLADVASVVAGRRPVVQTYHAGSMVKNAGRVDRLISWYEKHVLTRVFRRADVLVAVSRTSLAHRVPGARIISPGVDVEVFRPSPHPWGNTLLYVGRLDRTSAWKGVDVLLSAFALLARGQPDARLRIVGSGDAVPDHVARARALGVADQVEFSGELHGSALLDAYARARAVVLPSRTESESFGMALVEAMASQRPVVASAVGGIPDVVEDEVSGLLVPPGDPVALAAACSRLLSDDDLCARLAKNGRRAAETRFSWTDRLAEYMTIFREVTRP